MFGGDWIKKALGDIFSGKTKTATTTEQHVSILLDDLLSIVSPLNDGRPAATPQEGDILFNKLQNWISAGTENPSTPNAISVSTFIGMTCLTLEKQTELQTTELSLPRSILEDLYLNMRVIDNAAVTLMRRDEKTFFDNQSESINAPNVEFISEAAFDVFNFQKKKFIDLPDIGETWESMGDKLSKVHRNISNLLAKYNISALPPNHDLDTRNAHDPFGYRQDYGSNDFL